MKLSALAFVGIANTAHAGLQAMLLEQHTILLTGALGALVGVVDHAARRPPCGQRLLQGLDRQVGLQVGVERPTDDLAAEAIKHDRRIHEALALPDVGDVGPLDLVRCSGLKAVHPHPQQIAHPPRRHSALRLSCPRADELPGDGAPCPAIGRRACSIARKASLKKSSSACCWPISRSSSASRSALPAG